MTDKHRASFLTVSETYLLNVACKPLATFGYGTFHVGSSLTKSDYHDVDLRCILPNNEFDAMFSGTDDTRLAFLNSAISEWVKSRTGLPIDFQFQRCTDANDEFKGRRNAVGLFNSHDLQGTWNSAIDAAMSCYSRDLSPEIFREKIEDLKKPDGA